MKTYYISLVCDNCGEETDCIPEDVFEQLIEENMFPYYNNKTDKWFCCKKCMEEYYKNNN